MIELLFVLVVIGAALYLVNRFIPMAQPFKIVINVIVVLMLIAWLLESFGLVNFGHHWLRFRC